MGSKNQTKKIDKIHKHIKFLSIIFVANCPSIGNIYIIHKKESKHSGLEILVIDGIIEHIVSHIRKYIFVPKSGK